MSGHCPGSTRLAHACPGPPSCSSLPSSSLVDGWLPCRKATESRPHLARIAKRRYGSAGNGDIFTREEERSDVEYHPSPGKFNSLLFSSCGHNGGDVDKMQGAWSLSRSQRPFWKKARCHPVGLGSGPVCGGKTNLSHLRKTPPPSRLFASNVNENRLSRTRAFFPTPHALEERFHFRRPIALPCPGTAHRPGCLQAQAPSVFRKLMFAGVYGDTVSSKNLACMLRLDQINFWCLPLFSETLPAIFYGRGSDP